MRGCALKGRWRSVLAFKARSAMTGRIRRATTPNNKQLVLSSQNYGGGDALMISMLSSPVAMACDEFVPCTQVSRGCCCPWPLVKSSVPPASAPERRRDGQYVGFWGARRDSIGRPVRLHDRLAPRGGVADCVSQPLCEKWPVRPLRRRFVGLLRSFREPES